jgi:ATP-dependent Clp protease ATP-binding subunit ClpC
MFGRFTDQARRVVVHAQEEARMSNRARVGSEHLLTGLYLAGDSVAVQALESEGITLEAVRHELGNEPAGPGQAPLLGYLPYEREAKKALDLSRREALQLGHHHIGPEHILLGLIRGGESTGAQLLSDLGAELGGIRDQVTGLLEDNGQAEAPQDSEHAAPRAGVDAEHTLLPALLGVVESMDSRLSAVERAVGTGPDTSDLDRQIVRARRSKEAAVGAEDYENAASLRDYERRLLSEKTARQQEWTATQPDLPSLADGLRQLSAEVDRLAGLLRQQGIHPRDGAAQYGSAS